MNKTYKKWILKEIHISRKKIIAFQYLIFMFNMLSFLIIKFCLKEKKISKLVDFERNTFFTFLFDHPNVMK